MLNVNVLGCPLALETAPTLFSPNHIDYGTLAMLSRAVFEPGMKVLDLGCGCGVVGIVAALKCGAENVTLCDIDPVAVAVAQKNALRNGAEGVRTVVSDGLMQIEDTGFDLILSNPPYQSDFAVAKAFIEKGFNRLKVGGTMMMVTKRREWYKQKLIHIFGGVKIEEVDGYCVFTAQKRDARYAGKK